MEWLEILKAFVQGVVEGVTEWLPVSSTGHILLLDAIWPMKVSEAFFDVFDVVIQLGAILAVIIMFFGKLNPFSPKKSPAQKQGTWMLWCKVAVASMPAAILGLLMNNWISDMKLRYPMALVYVIAGALAIYGALFIWMERRHNVPKIHNFEQLSWRTALFIGMFQMLALIPGTSRSGVTILGAILLGTSRYVAAEFSFFTAIPVMFGASGLKLVTHREALGGFTATEWTALLVGTVTAFVVSVLVIRFLMNFIKKHDFQPFGVYRIALAAVIMVYFLLVRR